MSRGLFITLEGPEGSGKSSQARWLAQTLRRRGCSVVALRDPGSTRLGRQLRRALLHTTAPFSPLQEALLFIGGRVALVEERIRPALRRGRVVVCDRFHDSTVAYQSAGGLDLEWLDRLGRRAIDGLMPSLTLLLDVPTTRGFARLHRAHDRMERKGAAFHRRVREGYLRLARRERHRIAVMDARQPLAVVRRRIAAVIEPQLRRRAA